MKTIFSLSAIVLLVFVGTTVFAQYSKETFKSKTPFRMVVDEENIHEGHVDEIKLRLNRQRAYDVKFYEKGSNRLMYQGKVGAVAREKSAKYMLKYKKKKDEYVFIEQSRNVKPVPGSNPMTFSMETKESYAGPDGAYSKGSKTEGSLGKDGLKYDQQKGNAKVDKDGLSAKTEENSGAIPNLGLGKLLKKKKKDDGKTVVVLKMKKA